MRRRQVRRAFLQALEMAGGYAVAEELLWPFVDDLVKPPLSYGERGVTTEFFVKGGYIVPIPSTIDPGLKQWAITEKGKTLLLTL